MGYLDSKRDYARTLSNRRGRKEITMFSSFAGHSKDMRVPRSQKHLDSQDRGSGILKELRPYISFFFVGSYGSWILPRQHRRGMLGILDLKQKRQARARATPMHASAAPTLARTICWSKMIRCQLAREIFRPKRHSIGLQERCLGPSGPLSA